MRRSDRCQIESENDDPNRSSYGRDTLTKADLEEFAGMLDFAAINNTG